MKKLNIVTIFCFLIITSGFSAEPNKVKVMEYASNIREADGLAFDSKGDLFIASETWLGAIYRVSPEGKIKIVARGIPSADGIVIGKDDTIYVSSEIMNGGIVIVGRKGEVRTLVKLKNPEGLAFGPDGLLYVTEDIAMGRIVRIRGEKIETVAEGLDHPENITFDQLGNLYVTETGTGRILRVNPAGHQSLLTDQIEKPDGIFYSENFNGFFVTQDKPRLAHVYLLGMDGKITDILDNLSEPQGMITDSSHNLYVAEQGKHRIIRLSAEDIRIRQKV